ncbi:GNAT family N-acetyltransferase [Candidatus Roizmanbacteria bacterium]|nr:GNAT family N-acetyltransferase [Candidatus Roizmanbacteria bacterium]
MNIRHAVISDREQVLQLLNEASREWKASDKPSEVGSSIYEEIIKREDTVIFVAEENNKLIGLVTFYLLPNIRHGWHRGHVEDFFVTKRMRGKKVGSKLFDAIKTYCRKHHIRVIKLDSSNENIDAHRFYEKNGGKQTEKMFRFDL